MVSRSAMHGNAVFAKLPGLSHGATRYVKLRVRRLADLSKTIAICAYTALRAMAVSCLDRSGHP